MKTFASHLRNRYNLRTRPQDTWPPATGRNYINLAVISRQEKLKREELDEFTQLTIHGKVDDIIKKKSPLKLEKIGRMANDSFAKCILIEGAPGVGKTTLCWELCRKWNTILKDFAIVLLVRMRDKSAQLADDPSKLFKSNNKIHEEAYGEVMKADGESLLIILEGYDEMPPNIQRDSIYSEIIKGNLLSKASVIVTARPSSAQIVHEMCPKVNFQHVEVVGFTSADIENYIKDAMEGEEQLQADFHCYLELHPHIHTMMCNPLNCAITVDIYKSSKDTGVVPTTQTELYSIVTSKRVIRHFMMKEEYQDIHKTVKRLSDLPKEPRRQLNIICEFAYKNIVKNQLVFDSIPPEMQTLGLIQECRDLMSDESESFNFIHLTLQEYLAAYHIHWLSPMKIASCLTSHFNHEHMQVVLRFVAGLINFKEGSFFSRLFGHTPMQTLKSYSKSSYSFIEAIHWLFESQDLQIIRRTFGSKLQHHILTGQFINPFDCYAIGYSVSHSDCFWELEMKSCNITSEGVKMLCSNPMNGIGKLDLSQNKAIDCGASLGKLKNLQWVHIIINLCTHITNNYLLILIRKLL